MVVGEKVEKEGIFQVMKNKIFGIKVQGVVEVTGLEEVMVGSLEFDDMLKIRALCSRL